MVWQKRPYCGKQRPQLEELIKDNWNSESVLKVIAHELSFRQKKAATELREEVLRRIGELSAIDDVWEEPVQSESPDFLSYLGYAVSKNQTSAQRRRILDGIYSQQLPDGPMAKSWGVASTRNTPSTYRGRNCKLYKISKEEIQQEACCLGSSLEGRSKICAGILLLGKGGFCPPRLPKFDGVPQQLVELLKAFHRTI